MHHISIQRNSKNINKQKNPLFFCLLYINNIFWGERYTGISVQVSAFVQRISSGLTFCYQTWYMVHHHGSECCVKTNDCYLQCQAYSEDLYNQNIPDSRLLYYLIQEIKM